MIELIYKNKIVARVETYEFKNSKTYLEFWSQKDELIKNESVRYAPKIPVFKYKEIYFDSYKYVES